MSTPYWEYSPEWGWQLAVPIMMPYINGMTQVGTDYPGITVHNAAVYYENTDTRTKRFRSTEDAKAYALATYMLEEP